MNDIDWMKEAFLQALNAESYGEVPVGAVLVNEANQPIGSGFNRMIQTHDPTAHAEIVAIRDACQLMQNYRLENTTLYVTLEPCAMCAGAIIHARIKRLVFGARDFKTGAAGSVCNLFHGELVNHSVQIDEGVLQMQCAQVLVDFFNSKRKRHQII